MRTGLLAAGAQGLPDPGGDLLFLFTVISAVGLQIDQPAVKNLAVVLSGAIRWRAFVYALLLIYEPALLDILPMYIFFMLLSPWVLAFALRHGWDRRDGGERRPVGAGAVRARRMAHGLGGGIVGAAGALWGDGLPFNTFAWQFLWFAGFWMGASRNGPVPGPFAFRRGCWCWLARRRCTGSGGGTRASMARRPSAAMWSCNLLFDKWLARAAAVVNLRTGHPGDPLRADDRPVGSTPALAGDDGFGVLAPFLRAPGGGLAGAGLLW